MITELNNDLLPKYLNELLPKKFSNAKNCKTKQITDYVVKDLSQNTFKTKSDISVINRVCDIIENCCDKKDGINKADLIVEIFKVVFGHMNDDEITSLRNTATFLCDSKLIKAITRHKRAINYFSKVISSNLFF